MVTDLDKTQHVLNYVPQILADVPTQMRDGAGCLNLLGCLCSELYPLTPFACSCCVTTGQADVSLCLNVKRLLLFVVFCSISII